MNIEHTASATEIGADDDISRGVKSQTHALSTSATGERVLAGRGACGDSRGVLIARSTLRRHVKAGRNIELRF